MTIKRKPQQCTRPLIDLDGSDGNAFVLMGFAKRLAPRLGLSPERVVEAMDQSDYIDLLITFDFHFGGVVSIVTGDDELLESIENRRREKHS